MVTMALLCFKMWKIFFFNISCVLHRFSFPLETFKGHFLHVRLYDEDSLSRDEFLGRSSLYVQDIMDHGGHEMNTALVGAKWEILKSAVIFHKKVYFDQVLTTFAGDSSEKSKYDEVSGEVSIEARWFPLYDTQEGLSGDVSALGPSGMVALLSVFVYSCNNVMEMDEAGALEDSLPTTRYFTANICFQSLICYFYLAKSMLFFPS